MDPRSAPPLPIDDALPALRDALARRTAAVLQAPPGAGKTTRVPLALLDAPWLAGGKILMLEPRRLATRAAARRMADTLGERVGETIGYRVRLDTRVGPRTRVEVVTEGILTRMLQTDPGLEGVGLVIFDEFHERSLHADLGLALTLQSQQLLRDDLRVLVMSATLDGARVAELLGRATGAGAAPIVTSEGRSFPVDVRYRDRRPEPRPGPGGVEAAVAAAVRDALRTLDGDVLAFLPGAAEIRRVESALTGDALPAGVHVVPLYGNLPQELQDEAIAPSPPGRRKVVLSTPIAETSLTIEGVRVVVDSGLARVPRFSPRTGMTRLETTRISRASSEQRCGRAGRLGPGVCIRLWPEQEQHHLLPQSPPEIADADLAPLALELAVAGVSDPPDLLWLDPPPPAAFDSARDLLAQLGAIDAPGSSGRITAHGRAMAALPLHPRLAHMVLRAGPLGAADLACDLAALLEERDVLRAAAPPPAVPDADLRLRLEIVRGAGSGDAVAATHGAVVDRDALRRVREEARSLRGSLRATPRGGPRDGSLDAAGLLLAFAYPDRIAQRRPGAAPRYLLRNGRGAVFADGQALGVEPWIVVAELGGVAGQESRIFLAAPVTLAELEAELGDQVAREEDLSWDAQGGVVRARVVERLGALVLREAPLASASPERVAAVLLDVVRGEGLDALPWDDEARRLRDRVRFARTLDPSFPDVSDEALLATLDDWLAPRLRGARRRDDLARLDLAAALLDRLDWRQRSALDTLAPTHVAVPTGNRIRVDYADPASPVLAVRLQELFGQVETPRVGGGRVPVTLHLLSPAYRPVQVTRDLAGFWRSSYFDVRKDLRGRYPKHHWPDDPLAAAPTARAKPRR